MPDLKTGTNKLILGTASFGKPYGIKGDPVPDEKELEKIAHTAWNGGIRVIHTSWQYNLPKICEAIFSEFEWIEKCNPDAQYFKWRLRLGLSVYEEDELDLWAGDSSIDILQIPVNILDKRFLGLKVTGCEIHARSVFLQGLLLMENIPDWVSLPSRTMIKLFHKTCRANRLMAYEAALGYVLGLDEIDKVIVGVNSSKQLEQLLTVKPLKWEYDFSITDDKLLDPRKWPSENDRCPIHGVYGVCPECVKKWTNKSCA